MPAKPNDDAELLFGRFRLLETVIDDPLECVLRCWHTGLEKEVMLECGGREFDAIPTTDGRRRAMREAALLAELDHEGLPRILDLIDDDHGPVLVLDGYGGETLEARLVREGALAPEEVELLTTQLAGALAAVHGVAAVHRGLSTHNVMLRPDGSAFLRGFRFAKNVRDGAGFSSLVYGKDKSSSMADDLLPRNPAPEQFGGTLAGPKTDIFALGCVLYEAATGVPPFEDLATQGWREPKPLRAAAPGLARRLASVIESCLSRAPHLRPQSAQSIVDALTSKKRARPGRRAALAALVGVVAVLGTLQVMGDRGSSAADGSTRGMDQKSGPRKTAQFETGYRQSHALLIGISDYAEYADLPNARRDVEAIGKRLEELPLDWDVRVLEPKNTNRAGIFAALRAFEDKLDPEDQGFLYFAGHGKRNSTQGKLGWLLPSDAESDRKTDKWIIFKELESLFDSERSSKHVLIALDCCYGGLLASARGAGRSAYEERFTTHLAYQAITSGLGDEEVRDGVEGGLSPFAQAFLAALDRDGEAITSSALFSAVQQFYTEQQILNQSPSLRTASMNTGGEFVFFLR